MRALGYGEPYRARIGMSFAPAIDISLYAEASLRRWDVYPAYVPRVGRQPVAQRRAMQLGEQSATSKSTYVGKDAAALALRAL